MDSSTLIYWMIGICLAFMGLVIFSKPLKYIFRFVTQAVCGILASAVLNFILSPVGLSIGINYLNAFVIGLLGIPGLVSLYLLKWLL